jgi:hypothetical protein
MRDNVAAVPVSIYQQRLDGRNGPGQQANADSSFRFNQTVPSSEGSQ